MTNANLRLEVLEEAIYSKVLEVIRLLRESNRRIVLAESCTGGLAAAWFTSVSGASDVFCGSMVVYRNDTKSQWLGLDPHMLADEKIGPVSSQASEQLAREVLARTPEAHVALGITGHLGPNAPEELNHKLFLAGLVRDGNLAAFSNESPQGWTSQSCQRDLEQSSFYSPELGENRRFLQSLAVWESICLASELLITDKNHSICPKNEIPEKNTDY
jgi:PncC family amidohydrolase